MNFIGRLLENLRDEKFIHLFIDNIWDVDLADMQSLSKYNRGIRYLLCAVDFFSKYAWVVPLKDKRGTTIVNAFQKLISKGHKPNKIWLIQNITLKSIQYKMKENLLLLKDLSEL